MFQSTPPRRGRPVRYRYVRPRRCFNPRPREGGDFMRGYMIHNLRGFQSTPPRRGRPRTAKGYEKIFKVSIHAPAKGATLPLLLYMGSRMVSIHAPAKGATTALQEQYIKIVKFQSTPPRRGRLVVIIIYKQIGISCFNPRPREGGDLQDMFLLIIYK